MYDVDVGEWHITETSTVAKEQSRSDTPYVVTHERLSSTAYVLSIFVGLERNSLFYNQLISVPLNGMDKSFWFFKPLEFHSCFIFSGAFLLILLSFWVERILRITLNAISLFIIVTMLLIFAAHGPMYTPTVGELSQFPWYESMLSQFPSYESMCLLIQIDRFSCLLCMVAVFRMDFIANVHHSLSAQRAKTKY